ncbi:MAG: hypothetical protein E7412_03515 [Ruminococcaceae bacterium]|nr:hypothetical protein [Oscillospiraceae bacterium]
MLNFKEKENVKMVNKKMVAKLTTLVLALCLALGMIPANAAYNKTFDVWDGSVTENWVQNSKHSGTNTAGVGAGCTYYIDSAADFIAFRNAIYEGVDTTADYGGTAPLTPFWRCTVELRCNIDLNNINLAYGIGSDYATKSRENNTKGEWHRFGGIFNGNGYVIKGISIDPNQPDGALVQPGESSFDTDDNNINEAVEAVKTGGYIGLFSYFRGDNDAANAYAGRIINLHLEDVEITLPDEDISYKAGALIGYGLYDVNIASCSVKNVTFKRNAATNTQPRCYIGGMAGFLEATATYIRNSYVKGVDFSQLPGGLYMTNLFASGMMNVSNLNFLNVYSMDVKENNAEFTAGSTLTSGIYYYDSLIYTVGGTFTAGYANGHAYAEVPTRIINNVRQDASNVKLGDQPVNVYKGGTIGFAGGGTQSDRSYPYYMMPINNGGYTINYTPTASERIILGRDAKLLSGGSAVTAIPETAIEVTAQVEILNSTREAQEVDVVIAGYLNGKLVRVVAETLTAEAATVKMNNGGASDALGSVCVKPSVDTGFAKVVTTKSISTEGLDTIKVFCWNALGDLYALSPSLEITNN